MLRAAYACKLTYNCKFMPRLRSFKKQQIGRDKQVILSVTQCFVPTGIRNRPVSMNSKNHEMVETTAVFGHFIPSNMWFYTAPSHSASKRIPEEASAMP